MSEIKNIEKDAKSFSANGVDYYISKSLSIRRFRIFEKLKVEHELNLSLLDAKRALIGIYSNLNKGKVADAAVLAHNTANAIEQYDKREHHPILFLCALFINEKDEDVRKYDYQLMEKKVENWAEEGYDIADFFSLARLLASSFTPDFEDDSINISKEEKVQEESDTSKKS